MARQQGHIKHFIDYDKFGKYNILYLNINSIRENLHELEYIVKDKRIYFIILTGIKISQHQNNTFNLYNYQSFFNNRGDGKGGVAVYVHQSMISSEVKNYYMDNVHQLVVKIHSLNINLGIIYTHSETNKDRALQSYNQLIDSFSGMILFADIDIDLLDRDDYLTEQYIDDTLNQGFWILNKNTNNSATKSIQSQIDPDDVVPMIVDHILTDLKTFDYTISLTDVPFSNHKQILLSFNDNSDNIIKFYKPPKKYAQKEINAQRYSSLLARTNINTDDFGDFIERLLNVKNQSWTKIYIDNTFDLALPWCTQEIDDIMHKRNEYFQLLKQSPHSIEFQTTYNELCQQALKLFESLRSQCNSRRINECENNPKKMKKTINQIMENKNNEHDKIKAIRLKNQQIETRPKRIANRFNGYFKEAALELYNDIPNNALEFFDTLESNPFQLNCRLATEDEIAQKIGQMKLTTHRNEIISGQLLKDNSGMLVPTLTKLVNVCLITGQFPNELKIARIVPMYKKSEKDRLAASNYRPINILQSLSKLIEMIIYDRINEFCLKHHIFHLHQFGFLKKAGAAGGAATVLDYVRAHVNENVFGVCVFMDLKKAVDTIPHVNLINKLHKIGIRGQQLKLIKSYLQNRKQFVDLHGAYSSIVNCNPIGIPQGSNLGSLFFILYVNDMFNLPLIGKIIVYCDDITLVYVTSDAKCVEDQINYDLDLLNNWLIYNKLTINMEKIKYMVMSTNKKFFNVNLELTVKDQQIKRVRTQKYLGLLIQHNLSWNQQVSNVARNIENVAGTIKRLGGGMNVAARKRIYFTMAHKYFNLLSVYGTFLSDVNVKTLQRAQDKVIRRFFGRDSDGQFVTDTLYKDMRIMKVKQLIQIDSILLHRKMQVDFMQFGQNVHANNEILNYMRMYEKTTQHACERAYNALDASITNITVYDTFKNTLKRFISSKNE